MSRSRANKRDAADALIGTNPASRLHKKRSSRCLCNSTCRRMHMTTEGQMIHTVRHLGAYDYLDGTVEAHHHQWDRQRRAFDLLEHPIFT